MKYEIKMSIFIDLGGDYSDANAFAYRIAKALQEYNEVIATKTIVDDLNEAKISELESYLKTRNPKSF